MRLADLAATVMGIAGMATAVCAGAQPPAQPIAHYDETRLSQPQYPVVIEKLVPVPMRDGVELSADVYRPDASGTFPTLLWRTPYSNNDAGTVEQSKWFAQRGYVVVVQDVRGKYDSGGTFRLFLDEANDGIDTNEWVGAQPWSNGKIGTMGGSYLGYTQIAPAVRGSKYLTSMSASVTTGDTFNNWAYIDGALFLGFFTPWGSVNMDGHVMQNTQAYDWSQVFRHLPIATMDQAAGHTNKVYREYLKNPRASDPIWNGVSFENEIHKIAVPFLVVDGWYDLFLRGALEDHQTIVQRGATDVARQQKHLMLGPWAHDTGVRINGPANSVVSGPDRAIDFGPAAQIEMRKVYLRWHDHWLKGIDNGVGTEPPVKIFVMGENRWRFEKEWPLARTRYTKYFLNSGGRANSAAGDGVLSAAQTGKADSDRFVYDPNDPVPTLGGSTCCSAVPSGPSDQRKAELRSDVLVYTTDVLSEPMEVTGPIKVKLYAATDGTDTDWTAKLVDVHPDGYAQNLQDGIIRARYREGRGTPARLLEPGKVYEYTIDLWATSNTFLPGHRIRLEVSSSNFPRFDRNLNTGEDPMTGTTMRKAQQVVHHSKQYPSHVVLPIIPRERK